MGETISDSWSDAELFYVLYHMPRLVNIKIFTYLSETCLAVIKS